MKKSELKNALKLIDSMINLMETGYFPGKKSMRVIDSLRYLHVLRQSFTNGDFNALSKQHEESSSEVSATNTESSASSDKQA